MVWRFIQVPNLKDDSNNQRIYYVWLQMVSEVSHIAISFRAVQNARI